MALHETKSHSTKQNLYFLCFQLFGKLDEVIIWGGTILLSSNMSTFLFQFYFCCILSLPQAWKKRRCLQCHRPLGVWQPCPHKNAFIAFPCYTKTLTPVGCQKLILISTAATTTACSVGVPHSESDAYFTRISRKPCLHYYSLILAHSESRDICRRSTFSLRTNCPAASIFP